MASTLVWLTVVAYLQFSIYMIEGYRPVAFSAGLTHHAYPKTFEPLVFDHVFTNVGGGYDSVTGVFICPQAGIYVFHFNAVSYKADQIFLDLNHNKRYVVSGRGDNVNGYAAASNTVILQLAKNDEICIATGLLYKTHLFGRHHEIYASFSGYLVSAIDDEHLASG